MMIANELILRTVLCFAASSVGCIVVIPITAALTQWLLNKINERNEKNGKL